jgi:hypothetical protein
MLSSALANKFRMAAAIGDETALCLAMDKHIALKQNQLAPNNNSNWIGFAWNIIKYSFQPSNLLKASDFEFALINLMPSGKIDTIQTILEQPECSLFSDDVISQLLLKSVQNNRTDISTLLTDPRYLLRMHPNAIQDSIDQSEKFNQRDFASLLRERSSKDWITILCYAPSGTLGDIRFCHKMITLLSDKNPNAMFLLLIVLTDQISIDVNFLLPKNCIPVIIKGIKSFPKESYQQAITRSQKIIAFPNLTCFNESLGPEYFEHQNGTNRSKILSLIEYDYSEPITSNGTAVRTGLAEESIGIFLDPLDVRSTADLLVELHQFTLKPNHPDAKFLTFFVPQLIEDAYFSRTSLFFGYFNKSDRISDRSSVTDKQFLLSAILKSILVNPDKKAIDFIIRMDNESKLGHIFASLINKGLKNFTISYYRHDQLLSTLENSSPTEGKENPYIIRIFNPFHLHPDIFSLLLKLSDPFCAVTGDQSLSEAISQHKLFFYQEMTWKKDLYTAFLEKVSKCHGKNSISFKFYNMQISNEHTHLHERLANLLTIDSTEQNNTAPLNFSYLCSETTAVSSHIRSTKSLAESLPPLIYSTDQFLQKGKRKRTDEFDIRSNKRQKLGDAQSQNDADLLAANDELPERDSRPNPFLLSRQ